MCRVGIFFRLVQFRISLISLKSHKSFFQTDVEETINFFAKFYVLKVSKFQNEFMKSSYLQKYEPKIVRISALYYATLHPYNIWFIF